MDSGIVALMASLQHCRGFQKNEPIENFAGADVILSPIRLESNRSESAVVTVAWACSHGDKCWNGICRYAKARSKR